MPRAGWDTVTIPGAVSGWVALSQRYGKLPFADFFGARDRLRSRRLRGKPDHRRQVGEGGSHPRRGSRLRRPFPAARPGARGRASFSRRRRWPRRWSRSPRRGAKRSIAASSPRRWWRMRAPTAARMRWRTSPRTPATGSPRSPSIIAASPCTRLPPNGQGIAALMALGILEHFDLASQRVDSAEVQHLEIEAMKLAFADVYRYVRRSADDGSRPGADARPCLSRRARAA